MNIFDLYGIKEVADVAFYDIATGAPVLYLDTLKVTTVEETSSSASANGGKGNSALIKWDFGKEITLTVEDALFSMKSMAFMHGAKIHRYGSADPKSRNKVLRTAKVVATAAQKPTGFAEGAKFYDESGKEATSTFTKGETYLVTWEETIENGLETMEVDADSFPGTYKIVGDTYARNYKTGKDEFFQFTIPMAKVNFENTITMQADGDPSTFSMTLSVLRPEDGGMIVFAKYPKAADASAEDDSIIVDFSQG